MKRRTFLISSLQASASIALASSRTGKLLTSTITTELTLDQLFTHPSDMAKPHTIWHWMNGVVSRDGITADLESFKRAGLGGVQLFLVGGSEAKIDDPTNQILSEKWKSLFKHAVNECARLDLKFGTHNSPGWSSTGYKTIPPKDAMQKVVFTELKIDGGQLFNGKLAQPETLSDYYQDIVCWAIRDQSVIKLAEAVNLSAALHPDGQLSWQTPEGKWIIIRIGHTTTGKVNLTAPISGQGLEVDKLDSAPLTRYWNSFPKELLTLAGQHAGKTFNRFEIDSYEQGAQNWTGILPVEFKRRRGYDILPMLLCATGRVIESKEFSARFQYDWKRTTEEMFAENYYKAIQSLIQQVKGMELILEPYATGHDQPFESNNVGAFAGLPMCEFWQKPTPWGWDSVTPTVSGAHTWGKKVIAAEAFTGQPNTAWKVDPYALKSVGDRAFAGGVNKLFFHTSAHQPWKNVLPGMTMGQWGTHFGRTQTWWENGGHEWIAYLTRSQALLQQGVPVADLLYLVYDRVTPKEIPGFCAETIGTDAFLKRLKVTEGGLCLPNNVRYKLLVLPDTETMRPDIALKLKELVKAGAKVIGTQPVRSPGLANFEKNDQLVHDIGEDLWTKGMVGLGKVFPQQPITQVLNSLGLKPDCEIVSSTSEVPLLWLHRKLPDADIYFISNQTDKPVSAEMALPDYRKVPEFWHPENGKTETAAYYYTNEQRLHIPLELNPSGSVFIVLRRSRLLKPTVKKLESSTDQVAYMAVLEGNHLNVSENGTYTLAYSDNTKKPYHINGIATAFSLTTSWELTFLQKMGATNRMLQQLVSWTEFNDQSKYYSGTARYRTEFVFPEKKDAKEWAYLLDLGAVFNTVRVALNGQKLGLQWVPPYHFDLTSCLIKGKNTIEIEVTNLWANRMIGDEQFPDDLVWSGKSLKELPNWLDTDQPRPEPRRLTFATYKFFTADSPLLPSGLVGPVMIHEIKKVVVT